MSGNPQSGASVPPTIVETAPDKKESRPAGKMSRLPTLEALARRINPGASIAADSTTSIVAEPATSDAGSTRPRLPTSILSHRSSTARSISSVAVEPSTSEAGTPLGQPSDSSLVAPAAGEEPPKDIPKDKIHRGYKNVPSLDAITERLRARTGADAAAAANAVAKLSISQPPDVAPVPPITATALEAVASSSKIETPSSDPQPPALTKSDSYFPSERSKSPASDEEAHPLEYTWTLYHDSKGRFYPPTPAPGQQSQNSEDQEYAAGLATVGEFETVENFCRYFNWLKPPSQLETGSNYHLFKKGIKPMWEDASNANGGKWVITMKSNPQLLDRCWSWLAMGLVGEQIDEKDEVCGAVVSVRHKIDRIQVWTRSKDNIDVLNSIGKKLYKLLDLNNEPTIGLEFQFHSDDRPARNKFIHVLPRLGGGGGDGAAFSPAEGSAKPGFGGGWRGAGAGAGPGGAFGSFSRGPLSSQPIASNKNPT